MARELNNLLGLGVDWSKLRQRDLEKVRQFFFQELTLVKAANLSMSVFRQRLTQIPAVLAAQERIQVIRKQEAQIQRSKPQTVRAPGHLGYRDLNTAEPQAVVPQRPKHTSAAYIS